MGIYETRSLRVETINRQDGRVTLVTADDQVSHLSAALFDQLFSEVGEQRKSPRPARRKPVKRTKKAPRTPKAKPKPVRRAKAPKLNEEPATRANRNPQRDRAKELWNDKGKGMSEIEKLTGVSRSLLSYWKKHDGWKDRTDSSPKPAPSLAGGDDSWMS